MNSNCASDIIISNEKDREKDSHSRDATKLLNTIEPTGLDFVASGDNGSDWSVLTSDATREYYESNSEEYFLLTRSADLSNAWFEYGSRLCKGALVLDLGCGSGRDLAHFASQGFRTIGLDYAYTLLKLSETLSSQPLVLADFLRLPFAADVFDGIWAMATLLHVPRTYLSSVLSEVKRVMKPESVLFTSVKKGHGRRRDADSRYFEFYQMDEWLDRLEGAGFAIIKAEEVLETRTNQIGDSQQFTWIQCLAKRL